MRKKILIQTMEIGDRDGGVTDRITVQIGFSENEKKAVERMQIIFSSAIQRYVGSVE